MSTYAIDPLALRAVSLDLVDAAAGIDRWTGIEAPPRMPWPADTATGLSRLLTTAVRLAAAASTTADDLDAFVVGSGVLDGEIADGLRAHGEE